MHAGSNRLASCWVILQLAFDSKVAQVISFSYSSVHEYCVSMLLSSFLVKETLSSSLKTLNKASNSGHQISH